LPPAIAGLVQEAVCDGGGAQTSAG
jgi:hypothetical protein